MAEQRAKRQSAAVPDTFLTIDCPSNEDSVDQGFAANGSYEVTEPSGVQVVSRVKYSDTEEYAGTPEGTQPEGQWRHRYPNNIPVTESATVELIAQLTSGTQVLNTVMKTVRVVQSGGRVCPPLE